MLSYSTIDVDSCLFENNADGIRTLSQEIEVNCRNSTFSGHTGYGIICENPNLVWATQIDSCQFLDNEYAVFGRFMLSNSIIDGGANGVGSSHLGDNFDLDGCTIQNLSGTAIQAPWPTQIRNCTIRNIGGRVATSSDFLGFYDCVIDSNSGEGIFSGGEWSEFGMSGTVYSHNADGLHLASGPGASVSNCIFRDNSAPVVIGHGTSFSATGCEFKGNSGISISSDGSASITECRFVENTSDTVLWLQSPGPTDVSSCTFANNAGVSIVSLGYGHHLQIVNSLVANNNSVGLEVIAEADSVFVGCCDFFGNSNGDYSGIPDQTGLNGNISVDPLFCDTTAGDYHISDCSPCLPGNNDCGVLIGALGVGCSDGCRSSWYVATTGSDETGAGSENAPFATIQKAVDMSVDGDSVIVLSGTFTGEGNHNITTDGKDIVITGSGAESTILDCGAKENQEDVYGFDFNLGGNATVSDLTITRATQGVKLISGLLRIRGVTFESSLYGITSQGVVEVGACNFSGTTCGIESLGRGKVDSCQFSANQIGVRIPEGGHLQATNCLFQGSGKGVYIGWVGSTTSFTNCDFLNNGTGLHSSGFDERTVIADSCLFDGNEIAVLGTATILNSSLRNGVRGIHVQKWDGIGPFVVENCIIEGMSGSVFRVYDAGTNRVSNCIIRNNPGVIAYGIVEALSRLVLTDCTLTGNGGGIFYNGHIEMTGCLYANNAGAVKASEGASIKGCTFISNRGNAMHFLAWSYYGVTVSETIVSNNAGYGIIIEDLGGNYSVECCNVWGNKGGDYSGIHDQTGMNGNISLEPQFCDPASDDYHLRPDSPCASANNKCGVLIGALPVGCPFGWGDSDGDGSINISDAVYLLQYIFSQGPPPLDISGGDIDCNSKVNISDIVYLINYIFYGGPEPCEGCE